MNRKTTIAIVATWMESRPDARSGRRVSVPMGTKERQDMTIGTLYTIGYGAKSAPCTLETLLSEPGTRLVDVRLHPGSHRHPEWRTKALERRYGERYAHVPAFGNVHYRTPGQPIQLADPETGVRWVIPLLHQGWSLVLLCVCKDYEQCHRKVVFDLLTLRLVDNLRPPQQMRYESARGLYQGITSDGESRVSVLPDIFDWNRDLPDEELYDPNGWALEADGEYAWVERLEVRV
jgi:hypothetical protein